MLALEKGHFLNVSYAIILPGIIRNNCNIGSRLPFVTILRYIYDWAQGETSIKHNKREFNMSSTASTDWRNFMREVCVEAIISASSGLIGGNNKIVEIDETLFSKRKSYAGRILPEQWLFGGISREDKKCFIMKVSLTKLII